MSDRPLLEVGELDAYYGPSHVLHGISVSIPSGAVACLLGRNGAGKTTFVQAVMGLADARQGRIVLRDEDITRWPAHRRSRAGMALVPQGRRVFGSLTVRENLEVARAWAKDKRSARPIEDAYSLFPRLRERADQRARLLSGGEQQMLATARALMGSPDLVLLDEPTEGLSPALVRELGGIIQTLRQQGVTILLVEQHVHFALEIADVVHVMEKGRITHSGPADEVRADEQLLLQRIGVT